MTDTLWIVAASTPSMVLRYAAAFFLVVVGIGLIYALVRLGGTLGKAEKLLADVDTEVVPLLKQATETLDGVNTELDKVDTLMGTVVDVTEKVDQTTRAVEAAISMPAKKAAAFGAGVSQAVSSFFNRGDDGTSEPEPGAASSGAWGPASAASSGAASWAAPAAGPGPAEADANAEADAAGDAAAAEPDAAAPIVPAAEPAPGSDEVSGG